MGLRIGFSLRGRDNKEIDKEIYRTHMLYNYVCKCYREKIKLIKKTEIAVGEVLLFIA